MSSEKLWTQPKKPFEVGRVEKNEDLHCLKPNELRTLIKKQKAILDSKLVNSLPDKGEKIKKRVAKLEGALAFVLDVEEQVDLIEKGLSSLHVTPAADFQKVNALDRGQMVAKQLETRKKERQPYDLNASVVDADTANRYLEHWAKTDEAKHCARAPPKMLSFEESSDILATQREFMSRMKLEYAMNGLLQFSSPDNGATTRSVIFGSDPEGKSQAPSTPHPPFELPKEPEFDFSHEPYRDTHDHDNDSEIDDDDID